MIRGGRACLALGLFNLRVSHSLISRGCAKYHDLLEEVMLGHILLTLPSESRVAQEILRCEQCGVYPMLLAILIVLTSKDSDVILSMIGNQIIKTSLTVLTSPYVQVHTFGQ